MATTEPPLALDGPPPVVVRHGSGSLQLAAYTYCFSNGCADGMPPDPLPDIGTGDAVTIEFPLDWEFTATVREAGEACGRELPAPVETSEDGSHVLRPAGPAGTYDVTLMGRAQPGGDLFVSFRWTTTTDGPVPAPSATLALLADHDGAVDSYGVELVVQHLATSPDSSSAHITVRDASGEPATLTPALVEAPQACRPPGSVFWRAPDRTGQEVAATLGDGPYRYEVRLDLDGDTYVGTATWPADEDPEIAPAVPLTFDPPLPAMTGGG